MQRYLCLFVCLCVCVKLGLSQARGFQLCAVCVCVCMSVRLGKAKSIPWGAVCVCVCVCIWIWDSTRQKAVYVCMCISCIHTHRYLKHTSPVCLRIPTWSSYIYIKAVCVYIYIHTHIHTWSTPVWSVSELQQHHRVCKGRTSVMYIHAFVYICIPTHTYLQPARIRTLSQLQQHHRTYKGRTSVMCTCICVHLPTDTYVTCSLPEYGLSRNSNSLIVSTKADKRSVYTCAYVYLYIDTHILAACQSMVSLATPTV